jgi:hypothetical protein
VEPILWAICNAAGNPPEKGGKVLPQPNFDQLLHAAGEACADVKTRSQELRDLTQLRNKAKHRGIPPARNDASRRVGRALALLRAAVAQPPLGQDLMRVSFTSEFRNRYLADELDAAEALLDGWNESCSAKFLAHLGTALALVRLETRAQFRWRPLRSKLQSRTRLEGALREVVSKLDQVLLDLDRRLRDAEARVPLQALELMNERIPSMSIGPNGDPIFVGSPVDPVDEQTAHELFELMLAQAEGIEQNPRRLRAHPQTNHVAAVACTALCGRHTVCEVLPGERLDSVSYGDEHASVELFGLECRVPVDAVRDLRDPP